MNFINWIFWKKCFMLGDILYFLFDMFFWSQWFQWFIFVELQEKTINQFEMLRLTILLNIRLSVSRHKLMIIFLFQARDSSPLQTNWCYSLQRGAGGPWQALFSSSKLNNFYKCMTFLKFFSPHPEPQFKNWSFCQNWDT